MSLTSNTLSAPAAIGRGALWTGRVLSAVLVILLLLDATMKLIPLQMVVDGSASLGWPADPATIRSLGIVLALATLLYAVPRTAVLGAVILTGYMGGAIATHVRVGDPLFTHVLFGVYLGVALWAGLWLRDPRLRALMPFSE
ncbi:MAG: DoxX family protein [Pseudolabrys sp.]